MKYGLLICLTLLGKMYSCQSEKVSANFNRFIFVSSNINENISLKYNGTDTIFREVRSPNNDIRSSYALLDDEEKKKLVYLMNKLTNSNLKEQTFSLTSSEEDAQVLITETDSSYCYYTNYNYKAKDEINSVSVLLMGFSQNKQFINTEAKRDFWNFQGIIGPPPTPPGKVGSVVMKVIGH